MGTMRGPLYFACFGKRYKVHICYVLTKFTFDNVQGSDKVVIDVYDRMYFEPKYIKSIFNKWAKISKDESSIPNERNVNEFKNAYNAMRQIVQSDGYDSVAFLRLFHTISGNNVADKMFALILFSLTKENILRDVNKTPEWTEYVKNRNTKRHKFAYIENIFMYNANLSLKLSESYCPYGYIKIITKILLNLINTNQALYRERYLYQQLLFQPKFEPFNNSKMNLYIFGLNDIGQLDNKERRIQIARDLMFNKFYLKSAVELKTRLIGNEKNLEELRMRIEMEYKRYENEACLESERKAIENC
ncbi:hypothetical protein PAEPH01_1756 [Pancytospora epiphaga]|nr:hypothetical protein PAEPH01_1756 [Pancytospora epiphaga]